MAAKKKAMPVDVAEEGTVEAVVEKKKEVKQKRVFAADDMISCRSVTYGELLLPSLKNKDMIYSWANFGDTQEIEYQELRALRSKRSQYLMKPAFVVEDEDLLEEWKDLKQIYKNIGTINLDEIFDSPVPQFARKIQSIPKSLYESIKNAAVAKIQNGELDSLNKIKILDETLGSDLRFFIQ